VRAGSRMQIIDGLIAGIVRANKFALATRDVADLANCGIEIIDPWNR
jgi:predicted nucleic acid-binding protein